MSFPIGDYELAVAVVGYEEAFATFHPRVEVITFQYFNLSTAGGRIRAFYFLREALPTEVFIHIVGYLLYSLNLAVHPQTGKLVSRVGLLAFEVVKTMYSYADNDDISIKDQDVMIDKLIHNRAKLADGCCRKCGVVALRTIRSKRECFWLPSKRCTHRGEPTHLHYGVAKVHSHYMASLMRYVCYECAKYGYHLNDDNNLCDGDNKVLTTTRLADTL
jgi:hypothetical protein